MKNSTLKNLVLLKDPKFYLENLVKIKGKKPGQLIPFILKEHQKDLFNTIKRTYFIFFPMPNHPWK